MQFSTIVLALAASASAAVIPRAALPEQGRWHVQLSKSEPKNNLYLTAKFTSPSYPDGLRNACVEDPSETPTFKRCDHVEFDFTYDSETGMLNIQQNIDLPDKQTVFGSAYIPLDGPTEGGKVSADQYILVEKAIA